MEKQEALKRINAIEKEAQELRAIVEKGDDRAWIDLFKVLCHDNGLVFSDIVPNEYPKNRKQEANVAHAMIMEIVELANKKDNGGKIWIPDYNDGTRKWTPVFNLSASGFGFSYTFCDLWYTITVAGSRLEYKVEKTCEQTVKKYLPIYEKYAKY